MFSVWSLTASGWPDHHVAPAVKFLAFPLDDRGQATHRGWPFLELEQFLPAAHSLSLHRPFGTHCRTMSSTRTPCQHLKSDWKTHIRCCVMWNDLATERLCISYYGAAESFFIIHSLKSTDWRCLINSRCLFATNGSRGRQSTEDEC